MHYFFLEGYSLTGGLEVELAEADLNHAHRVLRLKPGDKIAIADAKGKVFSGVVTLSESRKVRVGLGAELPSAESSLRLTLFHSLSKGEKMDLIVRQAVELGVKKLVPVTTKRSIPDLSGAKEKKKIQRWQTIARSAAAQCRRAFLPPVGPVQELDAILPAFRKHRTLVLWEKEVEISLSGLLKQPSPEDQAVLLFVGPEGGFESSEIEAIRKAGAQIVHLGPRIMRTETAATVAVAMIQSSWGDLGRGREIW